MQQNTLRKILSALVEDYGYQSVRTCLEDCAAGRRKLKVTGESTSVGNNKTRARPRPRAMEVVENLEIGDQEKKQILVALAREFEEKSFMPNVNNVRAFLTRQGQDASRVKSRQQAVTAVFRCLADWETQSLFEFQKKGSYGGPKSLAAIAETIEKVGQQNRL